MQPKIDIVGAAPAEHRAVLECRLGGHSPDSVRCQRPGAELMLIIRAEQMRALSDAMQHRFESSMLRYFRSAYARRLAHVSDTDLSALVRRGIEESGRYGVVTTTDVARYIGTWSSIGPDFDRSQPWASEVLRSTQMTGTQKMDRIDDYDLFAGR